MRKTGYSIFTRRRISAAQSCRTARGYQVQGRGRAPIAPAPTEPRAVAVGNRAVPLAHGAGSASPAPPVRVDAYSRRTSATTAQVVSSAHASAAKTLIAPLW